MAKRNDDLDTAIEHLADLRSTQKDIAAQVAEAQQVVLKLQGTTKKHTTENGTTSTIVSKVSVILDEAALKKALGSVMWNKITTRVLDKTKLDAFIKTGEVKVSTVAKASTEKPQAPYVTTTRH